MAVIGFNWIGNKGGSSSTFVQARCCSDENCLASGIFVDIIFIFLTCLIETKRTNSFTDLYSK